MSIVELIMIGVAGAAIAWVCYKIGYRDGEWEGQKKETIYFGHIDISGTIREPIKGR